jgi:hypothetical protein
MRVVLGVSLTATSAVWAVVDTEDGTVIADEVVALEAANDLARATARSVQSFALQSKRDIDGVRMCWSEDARAHGIRLRTKLRLFGFETIETVSPDEAREGRNRTARHIAPHLVLAYGAARADLRDERRTVFQRLTARVPLRVASAAAVVTVAGVGLYALLSGSPSETPTPAAAVHPAAPAPPPAAVQAPPAALVAAAPSPATPVAAPAPEATPAPAAAEAPESLAPISKPTSEAAAVRQPADTAVPADVDSVANRDPAVDPSETTAPDADPVAAIDTTTDTPTGSTQPGTVTTIAGQPHLTGTEPAAGPVQAVVAPAPVAPAAAPATSAPEAPGPLSVFLGALP